MPHKHAVTSAPVLKVIEERWSPRSLDTAHTLTQADLMPALEAARWAPSASNIQPARFFVAFRGTPGFERVLEHLMSGNVRWAKNASALVVGATITHDAEGRPHRWAEYDLGQAVSYFTIQAHADGLFVHQMGGFEPEELAAELQLPESLRIVTVTAVGLVADPHAVELSERQLAQELGGRERLPIADTVTFL